MQNGMTTYIFPWLTDIYKKLKIASYKINTSVRHMVTTGNLYLF